MSNAQATPRKDLRSVNSAELMLNGCRFVPDVSGALYWPEREILIVSDLHFEKGSFFATRRLHLPPYDTGQTLNALEQVMTIYQPKQVIALGDSFHDMHGAERLSDEDRNRILRRVRL